MTKKTQPGCCCPRPGVLILCESLGLHVLPRSVPLTTSALSVARNHLCNVDNVLLRYSSLQELSLGYNRLDRFPRGLPSSLERLQLQENRITFITAGDLRNLGNLTRLDLEDNRIRAIQPGALLSLARLRMLSLKGNQLSSLPSHLPGSLTHLDVSANCISTLDLPSLAVLVNLQVLKINSNCLRSVPEHAFDSLPRLRSVELANNLWVCECDIMYLYRWLLTDRLRMATDLVCAAPLHLAHKLLLTLSVVAICPRIMKPSERIAPVNVSKVMLGNSSKESSDPTSDVIRTTTQTPHSPTPHEEPGCMNNTTNIQNDFLSTLAPTNSSSKAGVQVEPTPQTLTQTAPAICTLGAEEPPVENTEGRSPSVSSQRNS
ncbi:leucine-rich repeat transmembrane protein FLRT3 [Neoarius graeffei]|uniref:leucine-rich repeat transmembrane protein FLRT3 n=1 Tax=Neoarius graeffei TaxID=443677 RepID=UPI00298C707E|nr:leucine-rich repeat transmembrane protein FLRT3 [Neoarius graeffei]